ncbi:MAG TPA: hypothetical protein VGC84_03830, partial [Ilumatobacteraceae bacterium]
QPTQEPVADAAADDSASNSGTSKSGTSNSGTSNGAAAAETAPPRESAVRKINGPAAAPIELSDVAGSAILKRALPLVGGLALLWLVVRRLRRH